MCIMFVSFKIQKGKTRNGEGEKLQKVANGGFRERTSSFSLEYRQILWGPHPSSLFRWVPLIGTVTTGP